MRRRGTSAQFPQQIIGAAGRPSPSSDATTRGLRRPAALLSDRAPFLLVRRNRRLANDFENLVETLATIVTLASIKLALRRLAGA